MNYTSFGITLSFAVLMLGVAGCSPGEESAPSKPKSSETVGSSVVPGAVASMSKLGKAPAWELKDLEGATVRSDQFAGKVVVVDFWATWCPPCREEIPGYVELQKKYGKDGLVIIGVSLDQGGPEVVKAFAGKNAVNYSMVMGTDAVVAAFGGVEAIPTTFLIDRTGQIRDRKLGAEETAAYEKKILSILGEKV